MDNNSLHPTADAADKLRVDSIPGDRGTAMGAKKDKPSARAALLVIDLQRGLFQRPTPVYEQDSLLRNIRGLVVAAHTAAVPVVFVQHSNKMLVAGTESWELHPSLEPRDDDLRIHKTHGDAFEATDLDSLLRERSVGTVYVTGLVSEGCVRATCLGLAKRGYRAVLVSDAHSSFHRDAANRVQEWNEKLAAELDAVVPAREVDFDGQGASQPRLRADARERYTHRNGDGRRSNRKTLG